MRPLKDTQNTMVLLRGDQIIFLDRLSINIRVKTGIRFNRSALLRVLVDWLISARIDIGEIGAETPENDLLEILKAANRE